MKHHLPLVLLSSCALALSAPAARGESTLPKPLREVRFDQKLDAQVPLDAAFVDESGRTVTLGDYCREKPVILVLAYYRCPMLCTLVLNGLAQVLLELPFDAGREFEIVTVSFDARETPDLAAEKKKTYVERYGRPGAADGWHFLTGTQDSIDAITRSVGFYYTYDPARDQFAHASGLVVLTPGGKVSRYLYGVKFAPRDVRLGLVEASHNQIGSPVDQVLLFCFHYDPADGKYGAAVMTFVRAGGVLTLVSLIGLVTWFVRRDARLRQAHAASAGVSGPAFARSQAPAPIRSQAPPSTRSQAPASTRSQAPASTRSQAPLGNADFEAPLRTLSRTPPAAGHVAEQDEAELRTLRSQAELGNEEAV